MSDMDYIKLYRNLLAWEWYSELNWKTDFQFAKVNPCSQKFLQD